MSVPHVSVHALRYSSSPGRRASEVYYHHGLYGEPDDAVGMDYFFWLVRTPTKTVVVDCGFSTGTAAIRDRRIDTPAEELLARMGTSLESVDHVVLTHMHFDHVGNTGLFPRATFHMARAEYDYWTGQYRDRPAFSWPVEPPDLDAVQALHASGRLWLLDDEQQLTPEVLLTRLPGHTPGQLVTEVSGGTRQVVLASDAMHYYDEVRQDRPFYLFTDLVGMYDAYTWLRELDARPVTDVVPGHDPEVAKRYEEVERDCFDLLAPVSASTAPRSLGAGVAHPDIRV
ncbi:N-acyl homoserine lactonase family protein [Streptomyces sp. NPDC002790]|uniref:N-acyl homoserine lactonase family protein n=1 Tax=Streptomyces sp. NPDC002790 TaxID=3154431 RepID=UPI00332C3EA3